MQITARTISRLVEAVSGVAMGGVDSDGVAAVLQSNSSIDDQALGTAYAEIGVYEKNALLWRRHLKERLRWEVGAVEGRKRWSRRCAKGGRGPKPTRHRRLNAG